jgi:hypothetical protein
VYLEAPEALAVGAGWTELRRARAGQVSYQLLQWRGDDQGSLPGNI